MHLERKLLKHLAEFKYKFLSSLNLFPLVSMHGYHECACLPLILIHSRIQGIPVVPLGLLLMWPHRLIRGFHCYVSMQFPGRGFLDRLSLDDLEFIVTVLAYHLLHLRLIYHLDSLQGSLVGGIQWLSEGKHLYWGLKILYIGCQVLEVFIFTWTGGIIKKG